MRLNLEICRNVFLVGPMGVGKSTIGKMLARELSLVFIDSDHEVEKRAGANIPWIFDVEGEAGFRERESRVIDDLTQLEGIMLSTGGGCVLREDNREWLKSRGFVVFLDTSVDIQVARTRKDKKRPLLQNVNHRKVLREMKTLRDPLYADVADLRVFVGDSGSRRVVTGIVARMAERGCVLD